MVTNIDDNLLEVFSKSSYGHEKFEAKNQFKLTI